MKQVWEANYKPAPRIPNVSETQCSAGKPQELIASQMKRAKMDKRDELQIYLDDAAVGPNEDIIKDGVLSWWKVIVVQSSQKQLIVFGIRS